MPPGRVTALIRWLALSATYTVPPTTTTPMPLAALKVTAEEPADPRLSVRGTLEPLPASVDTFQ